MNDSTPKGAINDSTPWPGSVFELPRLVVDQDSDHISEELREALKQARNATCLVLKGNTEVIRQFPQDYVFLVQKLMQEAHFKYGDDPNYGTKFIQILDFIETVFKDVDLGPEFVYLGFGEKTGELKG